MSEYFSKKLASYDKVGSGVNLAYERKPTYGTALGGFCSIAASIFVLFFIFSEFYQLLAAPSFNQNVQKSFLVPS